MDSATLLGRLLPDSVARAESFDDPPDVPLFEPELEAVARAVPKRQAEYRTVRHCARRALGELGFAPAPILSGPKREPLWPDGVVGSLTHCAGYRGAAVAKWDRVRSVGIDAEPHATLPDGVLEQVASESERAGLRAIDDALDATVHADRVLFCAKEAIYKAWYPLARRWLGFEHAEVRLDPTGAFHARLLVAGPVVDGAELTELSGRWLVADGLILAAVTLLAPHSEAGPVPG
jgi:enterobactin synthetase component D / holo-[acyl-carrier protein] synthase